MVRQESIHQDSAHHFTGRLRLKHTLDRMESAVVLGLIGGGLAACMIGAVVYDVGRMFSIW